MLNKVDCFGQIMVQNTSKENTTCKYEVRIQRGGTGGPDPLPGKSQVIWVYIGNKQLDPPPPGKSWNPLENVGPPLDSGTLKNDRFL